MRPLPYTPTSPAACPKLGEFIGLIEQIITADQSAPRKQRHTAARIFARLRDEHGYQGGYDQVQRFLGSRRKKERETHLRLDHPPGGGASWASWGTGNKTAGDSQHPAAALTHQRFEGRVVAGAKKIKQF